MPLFEIVLRFADGHEEVRITDQPPTVDGPLSVAGRTWTVVSERVPADAEAAASYVCEPTS